MTAARFDNFLAQARTNLDPDEVIFVYDGAPAHGNPVIPAPNTELKMLPPYSPFLNINANECVFSRNERQKV